MSKINEVIFLQIEAKHAKKERLVARGYRCPGCSGNGWNWGVVDMESVLVPCEFCKGEGTVSAVVTIEWVDNGSVTKEHK